MKISEKEWELITAEYKFLRKHSVDYYCSTLDFMAGLHRNICPLLWIVHKRRMITHQRDSTCRRNVMDGYRLCLPNADVVFNEIAHIRSLVSRVCLGRKHNKGIEFVVIYLFHEILYFHGSCCLFVLKNPISLSSCLFVCLF